MKKMKNRFWGMPLLMFAVVSTHGHLFAYNLRQYTSSNGLSNSAILSVYQDSRGYMWFGSCDGINIFDGIDIQIYKPSSDANSLSGNMIESIIETEKDIFWVQTNYGLEKFDRSGKKRESYREFTKRNFLRKDIRNNVYVINEDGCIFFNPVSGGEFLKISLDGIVFDNILDMIVDENDILWLFSKGKGSQAWSVECAWEKIGFEPVSLFEHERGLLYCFHEESIVYFVDDLYILYEYDLMSHTKRYISNLSEEIAERGDISSIIKLGGDYYVGFKSNGLLQLEYLPEQQNNFRVIDIDIRAGIFCLLKDKRQDIVWVGTDGQGVYMYYIDSYSIRSIKFDTHRQLVDIINSPVRALFMDRNRNLWIGTKGDGVLRMDNFKPENSTGSNTVHFKSGNSALNDNSVYTFAKSGRNIIWIGSQKGLNYYSYRENRIKKLPLSPRQDSIKFVHSICEMNDSTLWIATLGEGIIRARISGTADDPVISATKRITVNGGMRSGNYFFTTYKENDSILWFGNRGYGAYRMDTKTEELSAFLFDKDYSNPTLNDIFAITKSNGGYWMGSSLGLIGLQYGQQYIFDESNGFPNNTIHAILEEGDNLWLSTNRGLMNFNTKLKTFRTHEGQNELKVTEFSDGACVKDEESGVMFFGGINGFVTITNNHKERDNYRPSVEFNRLSIFGERHNIYDFISEAKMLELDYRHNFFSVSFSAINYIDGNDYTFYYKLDGLSNHWIDNGSSNSATFTDISPGEYALMVKYKNRIDGGESPVYSLRIRVNPPWYRTAVAYSVYLMILLFAIFATIRICERWYRMKKNSIIERINRQQKEEIYESKLRFFTNITHELGTPLTLIYGPCKRILSYDKSDGYIRKYASLIQHNTEKLKNLIQELIEFRRLDTGNKTLEVRSLSVSEIITDITSSFDDMAESKNIDYRVSITENLMWNSDVGCLDKIVTNLISNAFKYTLENGKIEVEAFISSGLLHVVVSNTGKGIKQENIPSIFDRYKILNDLEISVENGAPLRNGLGLAICHGMVESLGGEISVDSTLNELTVFHVILPRLTADTEIESRSFKTKSDNTGIELVVGHGRSTFKLDNNRKSIMIIDDDSAMLEFLSEIFVEKYTIIPVNDPDTVMPLLEQNQPNLIISDVIMPGMDGVTLVKKIKAERLLSHIPLMLLSARSDSGEQVRAIEAGADIYITKPFDVEYLEKIVDRFLQRKEDLREYYKSALSYFELENGRLIHKGDKAFLEKIFCIIDSNITNQELSIDFISSSVGYSSRQLCRRLKHITDSSPSYMIKEYRLGVAARMLIETTLSIDEIMYKSGFGNRGTFFRSFSMKYGTTPKNYREREIEGITT